MADDVENLQMRHVCSLSPHKKHKSCASCGSGFNQPFTRSFQLHWQTFLLLKTWIFLPPMTTCRTVVKSVASWWWGLWTCWFGVWPCSKGEHVVLPAENCAKASVMLYWGCRCTLFSSYTALRTCNVPTLAESLILDRMCTSVTDSTGFELATRQQCERWHQLRRDRVTASHYKYVCSRRTLVFW